VQSIPVKSTPPTTPTPSRSSSFTSAIPSPSTPIPPSAPSSSSATSTPTEKPKKVTEVTVEVLQQDLNVLAVTLGQLQEDKWHLEEQIRLLKETIEVQKEDLERKETIIQHHLVSTTRPEGRATPAMELDKAERAKKNSVMGSLFKGRQSPLEAEMAQKMEAVLEDTLLKNIQLQTDIEVLGNEVSKLLAENRGYKQQVEELKRKLS